MVASSADATERIEARPRIKYAILAILEMVGIAIFRRLRTFTRWASRCGRGRLKTGQTGQKVVDETKPIERNRLDSLYKLYEGRP